LTLPLAALVRIGGRLVGVKDDGTKSNMREHSPLVNSVLGGLCAVERGFFKGNRVAGLSVVCLAEKK
jgi:hypothetical protein